MAERKTRVLGPRRIWHLKKPKSLNPRTNDELVIGGKSNVKRYRKPIWGKGRPVATNQVSTQQRLKSGKTSEDR
jgi:hypothetical protein